jgi:hypothetical protein
MKIKEFDEKVCIGSEVVFEGKIRQVVDIIRKTHEAILGKAAIVVRCSEFELYTGGEVQPYVEENDPPVKLGRPGKPVVAIFQNGKRKVFTSLSEASDVLGISRQTINRALHGENTQVVGIRFEW